MPPARLTCSNCGRESPARIGKGSTCPSCGHREPVGEADDHALVALKLELEACEDRWAKQRVRLSTIRSDGTLVRPNGLLIAPAALVSTAACVALVHRTLVAKEADGLPFLLSLALTALAVLSLVQLRRWLAYELGKRVFLHTRRRLTAQIAARQAAGGRGDRSSAPPSASELRGARHASTERAAQ